MLYRCWVHGARLRGLGLWFRYCFYCFAGGSFLIGLRDLVASGSGQFPGCRLFWSRSKAEHNVKVVQVCRSLFVVSIGFTVWVQGPM